MSKRVDIAQLTPSFRNSQWLFPIAVSIHNAEEVLFLPAWAEAHVAEIPWRIDATTFRIAAAMLTAAAFLVTWRSLSQPPHNNSWTYVFLSYTAAMWLNVFVPHIPSLFWFHSYVPGAGTAIFVVFPITTLVLTLALRERVLPNRRIVLLVFGVPLTMAAIATAAVALRLSS